MVQFLTYCLSLVLVSAAFVSTVCLASLCAGLSNVIPDVGRFGYYRCIGLQKGLHLAE
jgi:hypothetical protein